MTKKEFWGIAGENQEVFYYTLKNEYMEVGITNYGATLVAIRVPDKNGKVRDVLLGYDSLEGYQNGNCYFGGLVGRCANRIGNGEVTIHGKTIHLTQNEGTNHHHSAQQCTAFAVWTQQEEESGRERLVLQYVDKEKPGGLPGNVTMKLVYELSGPSLRLALEAISDQDTILNFTTHGYFQLDGHGAGSVEKQCLKLYADHYTPIQEGTFLPTGEVRAVSGTPFDFRQYYEIGERIHAKEATFAPEEQQQLRIGKGYDHNYLLSEKKDPLTGLRKAAQAYGPDSGIHMTLYTDCPCLQLYTGNYISHQKGKEGAVYEERDGFCLEPQYTPNAINLEGFEKPLVQAGAPYHFETVFRFGVTGE
ncbi:MAG: aldose epimerase family protein [Lachnospiraceae bacterium]